MRLVELLQAESPFNPVDLQGIIATAHRRYKEYEIPKRNGKGVRLIAQPAPEVKLLQRLVVEHVISAWPIHEAATAYRSGASIKAHADRHRSSRYLLKLDFTDFFPSITATAIKAHAASQSKPRIDTDELDVLARLLTWRRKGTRGELALSIGAPSSPACSNSVLFEFDSRVSAFCSERGVTYSRYADDLAFSTVVPNVLQDVEQYVRSTLLSLEYPRLRLNDSKTANVSKKYRRSLVGLVLTPDQRISIGREKKRLVRAMLNRYKKSVLRDVEVATLRGFITFAWSIEPEYVWSLARTYGVETLVRLGFDPRNA